MKCTEVPVEFAAQGETEGSFKAEWKVAAFAQEISSLLGCKSCIRRDIPSRREAGTSQLQTSPHKLGKTHWHLGFYKA